MFFMYTQMLENLNKFYYIYKMIFSLTVLEVDVYKVQITL